MSFEVVPINMIVLGTILRPIDGELVNDLRESIKVNGLLEPIIVRKVQSTYVVVDGNHRYLGCKGAELKEIPCMIKDINEVEAIFISLIGNVQRKDIDPIVEGKIYINLLKEYDIRRISERIGKSERYVKGRISIVENLDEELKEEVGKILTVSNALFLSKSNRITQINALKQITEIRKRYSDKSYGGIGGGVPYGIGIGPIICICPKCNARHMKGKDI